VRDLRRQRRFLKLALSLEREELELGVDVTAGCDQGILTTTPNLERRSPPGRRASSGEAGYARDWPRTSFILDVGGRRAPDSNRNRLPPVD
jgi:hypothetical protein